MIIIPTILTDDSDLALKQIKGLRGVAEWLQIDVMNGTMTENSTFDLYDLVGEVDDFKIEAHLMVNNPENYLEACESLGARRVYFHLEAVESPSAILGAMKNYGFQRGVVLSLQTEIEAVLPYLDEIQAIQIMTVFPGKQGQKFMLEMLEKVKKLKQQFPKKWVSVDGGVNEKNIKEVQQSGVDAVGVGSAIMNSGNLKESYENLDKLVN